MEYRNEQGQLHREDGPAITWEDGTQEWYINGELHRTDGPARVWGYSPYIQEWYWHNELHREDGPAVIDADGRQEWYWHNEPVSYTHLTLPTNREV